MKMRAMLLPTIMMMSFAQATFAADTATEVRKVSNFTVLKIQGNFTINITQGSDCALSVGGEKTVVSAVQSKNTGITLNVTMDQAQTGSATLNITCKDIQQISINGNCKVNCIKEIKTDNFSLNVDGNTEGTMDFKSSVFNFVCNTDKAFVLKGKADKCTAKVEGDGAVDMSGFKVDDLNIQYGSDTDIKIFAKDLQAKMAGAGNLIYYGNPKKKIFTVNGTGQPTEGK